MYKNCHGFLHGQIVDKPRNNFWVCCILNIFTKKIFNLSKVKSLLGSNLYSSIANFFIFMHANVSAAFISIFASPIMFVYLNPWNSFALPNCLSTVSFLLLYSSFPFSVYLYSSVSSMYFCQMCLVITF